LLGRFTNERISWVQKRVEGLWKREEGRIKGGGYLAVKEAEQSKGSHKPSLLIGHSQAQEPKREVT